MAEHLRIGEHYDTTCGTLWKEGTYFPRGTRVMVVGMHVEQGFCVRFPSEGDGEPLETWEDWSEATFLAEEGTVEPPSNNNAGASHVVMIALPSSRRGDGVGARRALRQRQEAHAEEELDREHEEAHRHGRHDPPFRQYQGFD